MIADVKGFTKLTEILSKKGTAGVELLTNCMNNYFTKVICMISAYKGDVVKFAGDSMIVFAGDSMIVVFYPSKKEKEQPDRGLYASLMRSTQCSEMLATKLGHMRMKMNGQVEPISAPAGVSPLQVSQPNYSLRVSELEHGRSSSIPSHHGEVLTGLGSSMSRGTLPSASSGTIPVIVGDFEGGGLAQEVIVGDFEGGGLAQEVRPSTWLLGRRKGMDAEGSSGTSDSQRAVAGERRTSADGSAWAMGAAAMREVSLTSQLNMPPPLLQSPMLHGVSSQSWRSQFQSLMAGSMLHGGTSQSWHSQFQSPTAGAPCCMVAPAKAGTASSNRSRPSKSEDITLLFSGPNGSDDGGDNVPSDHNQPQSLLLMKRSRTDSIISNSSNRSNNKINSRSNSTTSPLSTFLPPLRLSMQGSSLRRQALSRSTTMTRPRPESNLAVGAPSGADATSLGGVAVEEQRTPRGAWSSDSLKSSDPACAVTLADGLIQLVPSSGTSSVPSSVKSSDPACAVSLADGLIQGVPSSGTSSVPSSVPTPSSPELVAEGLMGAGTSWPGPVAEGLMDAGAGASWPGPVAEGMMLERRRGNTEGCSTSGRGSTSGSTSGCDHAGASWPVAEGMGGRHTTPDPVAGERGDRCTSPGSLAGGRGDRCTSPGSLAGGRGDRCTSPGSLAGGRGDRCTSSGSLAGGRGDGCTPPGAVAEGKIAEVTGGRSNSTGNYKLVN
eukprot:gene28242-31345_t